MARVEIASMPWGVVQDRSGNAVVGASVTLKNLDGSPATHWSAATAGTSTTAAIASDINGTLTGRFIEGGQYLWSCPSVSVTDRRVEAVSGSVESGTVFVHKQSGVAADGTTDDTAAVQALIDAHTSGTVFDFGTSEHAYVINTLIPKSGHSYIGNGARLIHKSGASEAIIYHSQALATINNVTIRGLRFAGLGQSITAVRQAAVRIDKASDVRVEDCVIEDFADSGIDLIGVIAGYVTGNTLRRCCNTNARNAIYVAPYASSTQADYGEIVISGNVVEDCNTAAICVQSTVSIKQRVTVTNNVVVNAPLWSGIALEANTFLNDVVVDGNVVTGALTGIFLADTGTFGVNRATGTDDLKNIVITNNLVNSESLTAAVGIQAVASNTIVSGNVIRCNSFGLFIGGDSVASRRVHNQKVVDNIIEFAGASLTNVIAGTLMDDCEVSRNQIAMASGSTPAAGISLTDLNRCDVKDNHIRQPGRTGITMTDPRDCEVSGNRIIDANEGSNAGATGAGISLSGAAGSACLVRANFVVDTRGTPRMTYGVAHSFSSGVFMATGNTLLGWTTSAFQDPTVITVERQNTTTVGGVVTNQGKKETWGTAAPVSGTWAAGDVVWNSTPTAGGNIGWACTTGGSPGTWKVFGLILDASNNLAPTGSLTMVAPVNVTRSGAAGNALTAFVTSEANARFIMTADGFIVRGPGGATAGTTKFIFGTGSPEGVHTAGIGSIFQRSDGGAVTSLYVKESGTGNTGWVAK